MAIVGTGQISLTDLNDGISASVSPPGIIIPTDVNGNFSGSFTATVSIYIGAYLDTGWSFSGTGPNVTFTVGASTGLLTVTGSTQDSLYVDVAASKFGKATLTVRVPVVKSKQGNTGGTGATGPTGATPGVVSVIGERSFKYLEGQSTPTTTSIVLTATLTGALTTYDWEYWNGTSWTNLSGTQNNSTYTLTHSQLEWGAATSLRVRCVSGSLYDEITIVKMYDGTNALSGYLTNEVYTTSAAANGTGYTLTNAGGTFKVFKGITDVTTSCTFNITGGTDGGATWTKVQNGLTLTINETTGVYTLSGASWTSSAESFTINAVYSGVTVTKKYTISKSITGATGPTGTTGPTGASGAAGTRGTRQLYSSNTLYVSGYDFPTQAAALILAATGGTAIVGDSVTFYNNTATGPYVYTLSCTAVGPVVWSVPGTVIDGSLLVTGSVTASKINSNGLDIRDASGNVLFSSGVKLQAANLATGLDYAPQIAWNFQASALNSFLNYQSTFVGSAQYATLAATTADPQLHTPTIALAGGTYDKVRMRIKRTAGTSWEGILFYSTAGHGASSSYNKVIPWPVGVGLNEWVVLEWDMANLTSGGTDWVSNTIIGLRFDLGVVSGDTFLIDWISVGRYGPLQINASNISTFIADLAVNTIQIANNAITVPISAKASPGVTVPNGDPTGVLDTALVAFPASGRVQVIVQMLVYYAGYSGVQCNADLIRANNTGYPVITNLGSNFSHSAAVTFIGDATYDAAGTYRVRVYASGGSGQSIRVDYVSVTVLGVMK